MDEPELTTTTPGSTGGPESPGPATLRVGRTLVGRYDVLAALGQGGMGVVWRCRDRVAQTIVAVKQVPSELERHAPTMEQIRRNFRLVEKLHHPNIGALKTLEQDPATGAFFVVMEFVPGRSLREHRALRGGCLPANEALALLRPVAAALDYAHRERVIHRDIKPENIMVAENGQVKLLDFGIAGQFHDSLSALKHCRHDSSGTRPYMAPEQWRGEYQNAATDQYALAVVLYELVAGRPPFTGADVDALREAVLQEDPTRPPGLTGSAWRALRRGLSKQRTRRHASCTRLIAACARTGRGWTWALGAAAAAAVLGMSWPAAQPALAPERPTPPGEPVPTAPIATEPTLELAYTGDHAFPHADLRARLAAGSAHPRAVTLACRITQQERSEEAGEVTGVAYHHVYMTYQVSAEARHPDRGAAHTSFPLRVCVRRQTRVPGLPDGRAVELAPWRSEILEELAARLAPLLAGPDQP